VGMGLGLVVFLVLAKRLLGDIGTRPSAAAAVKGDAKEEHAPLTHEEKDRIKVILILAVFVIFFWAAFEQAGGLMNLYTDEKVNRHVFGWQMPTTWFQAVNPFFIVVLGPVVASLWTRLGKIGKDPSIPLKMAFGLILL